ncbi:MAG: hypothetical protein UIT70_00645 [Clostridia bacterium]|nr:hypothetical protein [Clostridia bacterium]
MKFLKKKIKNSTAIIIILFIAYILLSFCSIKLYIIQNDSNTEIEKIWSIISNITVVIGVISIFLAFGENELNKKEATKGKINLEIEIAKELNNLELLQFDCTYEIDINSNIVSLINKAIEYIIKTNLYNNEELIDRERYLKINLSNHKKLIYILINVYYKLLKTGNKAIIEKLCKNKQYLIEEIKRLEENDEEIKLLTKQIEYIDDFNMSNIIKVSII